MTRFQAGILLGLAACVGVATAAAPPRSATTAMKKRAVAGNTRFAWDLYGKLRQQKGNLFLSPFNVSTALAMTSTGARGQTLAQMEKALHLPEQERLHPGLSALLRGLTRPTGRAGGERAFQLHVANAVWAQKDHPFLPEFAAALDGYYQAAPREVDFHEDAGGAQKAMNAWVAEQTRGYIKKMPVKLDGRTRMVLASAIYFQGTWQRAFDPRKTKTGPFRTGRNGSVRVPLMHQAATFGYHADRNVQVLEMPYRGDRLSMVVLLPAKPDGLAALEKRLGPALVKDWLGRLKQRVVDLTLPRFKVESTFELAGPLAALGMGDAFTSGADFSGMDGTSDLFLSAVAHKAVVEVEERGTTAAAVTAVNVSKRTVPVPPELVFFKADRPFLFLIRDRQSDSVLFLGRLAAPR
jgi:serpin B